eukprot:SAG31_NODE_491_length_14923_cov_12.905221_13_plen_75_part_00
MQRRGNPAGRSRDEQVAVQGPAGRPGGCGRRRAVASSCGSTRDRVVVGGGGGGGKKFNCLKRGFINLVGRGNPW